MSGPMYVILMCFSVPFAIVSGIAAPIFIASWLEKRLGLKSPTPNADEGERK